MPAPKFATESAFESQRANGFGEQNVSGISGYSFLGTSVLRTSACLRLFSARTSQIGHS
jgi:hypothetical protein